MQMMTPTHHEKSEWSRLAQAAYGQMRNDLGHAFSTAASLPHNGQMSLAQFDALQAIYRAWLVDGSFHPGA